MGVRGDGLFAVLHIRNAGNVLTDILLASASKKNKFTTENEERSRKIRKKEETSERRGEERRNVGEERREERRGEERRGEERKGEERRGKERKGEERRGERVRTRFFKGSLRPLLGMYRFNFFTWKVRQTHPVLLV